MDTTRLKRFAAEARNILMQGVAHRLTALGFEANGTPTEEPQLFTGGATFMGDVVPEDFYDKWQSLNRAIKSHGMKEIAEEAAYTWFNRLMAIRIMVKNGLIPPILQYESDGVHVPLLVTEARQGRTPVLNEYEERKLNQLLDDDSQTAEQFQILIVAFCHQNPVINSCFGHISDYTELLLPANILADGGFIDLINHTDFIAEEDYKSPELIGWLYQFYISEKKDEVFAKKGKMEADDIPAATQIFTPNWIVKYMVQNTVGRIYLDNNPYSSIREKMKYLVEPEQPTPDDAIFKFDDIHKLTCADLSCGSGHILNECFDLLYDIYMEEGYSRKQAVEGIFKYNLTGVDIDTRAKQLAQFALLLKACQKDSSFADAHIMPRVLDMPEPYTYHEELRDTLPHFLLGGNQKMVQEITDAIELMNQAHNLGSIMKFKLSEATRNAIMVRMEEYENSEVVPEGIKSLMPYMRIILALTEKYATVVMNPPYMGCGNMNTALSNYVKRNYEEGKADLFSTFMILAIDRLTEKGKYGMINMHAWMFLSSFEELRNTIIDHYHIDSLLHLGPRTFDELSGEVVQNASFIISNNYSPIINGIYFRLVEGRNCNDKEQLFITSLISHNPDIYYPNVNQNNFERIPGSVIGYWVSSHYVDLFHEEKIDSIGISDGQNITGDNNKYLRLFWEVSLSDSGKGNKWVPIAKGGPYRKWYGNIIDVINWSEEARNDYKTNPVARIQDEYLWYRDGITWNLISSGGTGFRILPNDCLFNKAAPTIVIKRECLNQLPYILAFLNTKVVVEILKILNPTYNTNIAEVFNLPYVVNNSDIITDITNHIIELSKNDWDAHETSWDFGTHPLLTGRAIYDTTEEGEEAILRDPTESIKVLYDEYIAAWTQAFYELHSNEEELNRQFIDIYGLHDELTPNVPLDEITILQQGEISIEDNQIVWHPDVIMKQLISYAVGCMMGRYSIDKDGLILANQGDGLKQFNELVPNSKFEPDDDGIIPLMSAQSDFADNATVRFKQWLAVAFGEETLVENLNFIEAALGKSIDDYFVKDFWKDHKKMYQNRPIYWLFSSKKGAFQCLTYMHRMDAYTAERVRTKYLLPHIEWLLQKQNELNDNLANLTSQERRELDNITKQIQECREYHDRLHVVADHQIGFDLDDGVVVNYAKFGDVLAAIK